MHIRPGKPSDYDIIKESSNDIYVVDATIGGTGAQTVNVFEFTGTVRIVNQWAEITRVGTLTNLTNMYATIYDGTNTVNLTADGATLSGATVNSFFTKDKTADQTYSVNLSDQCRMLENTDEKKVGRPFVITAKNGATNYIRYHYTTTDNPVDFDIKIFFEYQVMNGGSLTLAS
jgi:hypothetical protein